jgi:hypothetical protein
LRELRLHVALELRRGVPDAARAASHQCNRERRALPQVVVIGLRDRGAEAALQVRLERLQFLALPLEAPVVGEVELDLDQADEAQSSRST